MTAAGSALTALHYRQQLALRSQAVRDAAALWRVFRPGDRSSWDQMTELARPIVTARHQQSGAIAARYFEGLSVLETGKHQRAELADPLPDEQIDKSLASTGLAGVVRAVSAGFSIQAASQVGFVRFQGGLTRLALMGGRATIVASSATSRLSTGWTRVTGTLPCAYCADLADAPITSAEVFPAHDSCACSAAPSFS